MDAHLFLTHSLQDAHITRILAAALDAVEPGKLVRNYLLNHPLPEHKNIYLLGIGKASEAMTFAADMSLRGRSPKQSPVKGLIITKHASRAALRLRSGRGIAVIEGGHPIPDERSVKAGEAALEFVSRLNEDDLLICLISGGGSALVTVPNEGVTLEDIQSQTSSLLASGATIHEINKIRCQLDRIKGGGLARATKAKIVSLILSDVIGNSLETIASGLTVDSSLGGRVQNFIVGDIRIAAQAVQRQASVEGFDSELLDLQIQGEARDVGLSLAKRLKEERRKRTSPFCLIAGGETTVTIKGNGKGGRNQELALSAVDELSGIENILFISLATDGDDGPTDAAGAVVGGETCRRAEMLGLGAADCLSRNDAYTYFESIGDLIKSGYTGTNVNDIILLIGF